MSGRELWHEAGADLYLVLGVLPNANAGAIQDAWRAAAKRTHPDRGGTQDEFRAVHIAYLVLSDPEQRARYDRSREPARPHPVVVPPPPPERWQAQPPPIHRNLVWLAILAGVLAVVLSYAWPVFTIVTGVVVGAIVAVGYVRLAHLRRYR